MLNSEEDIFCMRTNLQTAIVGIAICFMPLFLIFCMYLVLWPSAPRQFQNKMTPPFYFSFVIGAILLIYAIVFSRRSMRLRRLEKVFIDSNNCGFSAAAISDIELLYLIHVANKKNIIGQRLPLLDEAEKRELLDKEAFLKRRAVFKLIESEGKMNTGPVFVKYDDFGLMLSDNFMLTAILKRPHAGIHALSIIRPSDIRFISFHNKCNADKEDMDKVEIKYKTNSREKTILLKTKKLDAWKIEIGNNTKFSPLVIN